MTRQLILVALVSLLMGAAADAQPYVKVHGFQDGSRGKWSSLKAGDWYTREVVAYWTRGFISGYNWFNPTNQVLRDLSYETMVAYVDKYCRDNPLKGFTDAAIQLICETHDGPQQPFPFCDSKK
jgi:hypothetical protein